MIELDDISRIGFGAYRVSTQSGQHRAALLHALNSGCTLVDTASTYTHGESEQLIGDITHERPDLDFFLVTKAGYPHSADEPHSLDPDFLHGRLQESMRRTARSQIDALLLHNPENCFDVPASAFGTPASDAMLRRAFAFLEDRVQQGSIRYWGISSNTLHLAHEMPTSAGLQRVLTLAGEVAENHHFRLIQFPFNLLESEAAQPGSGESFLALAQRSGLRTIGNRPLNANGRLGCVRLATCGTEVGPGGCAEANDLFDRFVDLVRRRLAATGSSDDPFDFTIMKVLRDTWTRWNDPELARELFRTRLAPFVACLYPEGLPAPDRAFFESLQTAALVQTRRNMDETAIRLRPGLERDGTIAAGDPRPLAEIAVDHALQAGIRHVLVGMRDPAYVDTFRKFF